ncbi:MAG: hypothetical protein A3G95_08360 [Flavobacteria bacterium RIFCSPLOWO2_12_FULL_31_7]|nr:MAG: hypothetical protein A3G95_08360 [Flavobacteria bacterium RIFCSPLOWO2_12_FULL_31_7]
MQIKFYFILAFLLNQFSFSQEILGNYCSNPTNKNNVKVNKACFVFKSDFTFEEYSINHIVSETKGKYEIKKKFLILYYDDVSLQNKSYKFKIIKNKNDILVIKGLNNPEKYYLIKTTNLLITSFSKTHKSLLLTI